MQKIAAIILTILMLTKIIIGIGSFLILPLLTGITILSISLGFFGKNKLNHFGHQTIKFPYSHLLSIFIFVGAVPLYARNLFKSKIIQPYD